MCYHRWSFYLILASDCNHAWHCSPTHRFHTQAVWLSLISLFALIPIIYKLTWGSWPCPFQLKYYLHVQTQFKFLVSLWLWSSPVALISNLANSEVKHVQLYVAYVRLGSWLACLTCRRAPIYSPSWFMRFCNWPWCFLVILGHTYSDQSVQILALIKYSGLNHTYAQVVEVWFVTHTHFRLDSSMHTCCDNVTDAHLLPLIPIQICY